MTSPPELLWTQPDWLKTITNWIDLKLRQNGLKRTDSLEQSHIRPWSTVIKVFTSTGPFFFKAVVPNLAHEAALTQTLARWQPDRTPVVLAADSERGWLLLSDSGRRLRDSLRAETDIQHWLNLLPAYAELQIELAHHLDGLLGLGVPDRRLPRLPVYFKALLTNSPILALGRPGGLSSTEHRRLRGYFSRLNRLCDRLSDYGVPPSLDHGDFHDGNIFVQGDRYLLLDWGDSSVTHPFFSLRSTFVSLEHTFGLSENSLWFSRLRDSYLEPWTAFDTRDRLVAAFDLSRYIAPISAALRWLPALSNLAEPADSEYGSAIPSLLQEFLTLNSR